MRYVNGGDLARWQREHGVGKGGRDRHWEQWTSEAKGRAAKQHTATAATATTRLPPSFLLLLIPQVGAFAAAWFSLCDRLEHFSLATNPIGPKGVSAFCEHIGPSTLPRLKFLNFFNNQIGDEGLRCIAELLRRAPPHLPNLKTIRITGKNDTTPEGKQVLEEACRARSIKIEG
eukprot:scaffold8013_cov124-Isochrysis_galbana.AAC.19